MYVKKEYNKNLSTSKIDFFINERLFTVILLNQEVQIYS